MKFISLIIFSVMAVLVNAQNGHYDLRDAPLLFLNFVKQYNRQYNDAQDVVLRYALFVTSLAKANKMNEGHYPPVFGITKFSDYTEEEFNVMNGYRPNKPTNSNKKNHPLMWS